MEKWMVSGCFMHLGKICRPVTEMPELPTSFSWQGYSVCNCCAEPINLTGEAFLHPCICMPDEALFPEFMPL